MNILLIPHSPLDPNQKSRGEFIAEKLAKSHKVYFVTWYDVGRRSLGNYLKTGTTYFLKNLLEQNMTKKNKINIIKIPCITAPKELSSGLTDMMNDILLKKVIKALDIEVVINQSSKWFNLSNHESFKYVYDLVDLHNGNIDKFIKSQLKSCDTILTCSHYLTDVVKRERLGKPIFTIPNGTDVKTVAKRDAQKLRKNLDISDKIVIGHIGNHGYWSGMEFQIKWFHELGKTEKDVVLLIVGHGSEIEKGKHLIKKFSTKNVMFTGPVNSAKVHTYYEILDLGILPFELSKFTKASFPIKILEYTSHKKFVISVDIPSVRKAGLSNVKICKRQIDPWIKTYKNVRKLKWKKGYDEEIERYTWKHIADEIEKIIS